MRVSFLSWVPPMAVGFALLIARHSWWPRPSVLSRLVRVYRRITSSVSWQETWGIFVATRVAVLVVGLLAIYTIGYPDEVPNFRVSNSEAMNLPARWDAGWYLNIASGGYRWDPQHQERQQNIAFFPGYPARDLSARPLLRRLDHGPRHRRRPALARGVSLGADLPLPAVAGPLRRWSPGPRRHPADRHLSLRRVLRRHLYGVDISPRRGRRNLSSSTRGDGGAPRPGA